MYPRFHPITTVFPLGWRPTRDISCRWFARWHPCSCQCCFGDNGIESRCSGREYNIIIISYQSPFADFVVFVDGSSYCCYRWVRLWLLFLNIILSAMWMNRTHPNVKPCFVLKNHSFQCLISLINDKHHCPSNLPLIHLHAQQQLQLNLQQLLYQQLQQ